MSNKPLRDIFGEALRDLGAQNPKVVALDADLAGATRSGVFGKAYPERFFNVGITEANMVSVAAGLSTCGYIPFACTFSFLMTLRAADQIRSQVCYPKLNVKLVGTNGGLSGFGDGATHQSVMDLAIMRAMPGMTVIIPSDAATLRAAVFAAADYTGPLFLRVPRVPARDIHDASEPFAIGKGYKLRDGKDVTLVATGLMAAIALDAADALCGEGLSAEVIEIPTLKPMDSMLIAESLAKTHAVVTVEEHSRFGGLFSAIAETAGEMSPSAMGHVAIEDRFGESGEYDEILESCGLTVAHIVEEAKSAMARKQAMAS